MEGAGREFFTRPGLSLDKHRGVYGSDPFNDTQHLTEDGRIAEQIEPSKGMRWRSAAPNSPASAVRTHGRTVRRHRRLHCQEMTSNSHESAGIHSPIALNYYPPLGGDCAPISHNDTSSVGRQFPIKVVNSFLLRLGCWCSAPSIRAHKRQTAAELSCKRPTTTSQRRTLQTCDA